MTDFARSGESSRGVGGIIGTRVIFLMARITKRAVQGVIAIDVAVGAGTRRHHVGARQLESCARVIEGAVGPAYGIVATFAGGREARRGMSHWAYGIRVISLMARYTCGARQVVVVVDMAIRTLTRRDRV